MTLYTLKPTIRSSPTDLDQLVKLLNGVDTTTALTVNNRIQAACVGATASSGYVGVRTIVGDANLNSPKTQGNGQWKPQTPQGGSFTAGDVFVDYSGLFWVATADTSGGVTPWVSVGKAGDNARTRQRALGGNTPADVLYKWEYGNIQYSNYSASDFSTFGFRIPTTGFYELSSTFHTHGAFDSTASFTYGWARAAQGVRFGPSYPLAGEYGDVPDIVTLGDTVKGGSSATNDGGGTSEDLLYFTSGDHIAPYLTYYGPRSTQGAADGTLSATVYLTLRLFSASAST